MEREVLRDSRKASMELQTAWPVVGCAVLFVSAWAVHYSAARITTNVRVADFGFYLMLLGAVPWFLLWAGTSCATFALLARRKMWREFIAAAFGAFILGAIWWSGVSFKFHGCSSIDALLELTMMESQLQYGSASLVDELLFTFVGPILNPLQLHGPMAIDDSSFVIVLLSTCLLFGYLVFVGRCGVACARSNSFRDGVKFVGVLLIGLIPSIIRILS